MHCTRLDRRRAEALIVLLAAALPLSLAPAAARAEEPHHQHAPTATSAHAHHDAAPPAPIGVMGDHLHPKGEFMLSYRYMRMHMDGNRKGSSTKATRNLLRPTGTYVAVPTEMNMNMHMFGAMYAPTDWATLMLMVPILTQDMDHKTAAGGRFTTRTKGVGDISASVLLRVFQRGAHGVHLNAGIGFPSGSIDEKDDTPASMGRQVVLPYPMQTGNGTFSLQPGATYTGSEGRFFWGVQGKGRIQLGRNDEDYRVGNDYLLTTWGNASLSKWWSVGGRLQWRQWFNISGSDDRLGAPMGIPAKDFIPTADPDLRAGHQLELGPSIDLRVPSGPAKGLRIGLEALLPIYRNLDGPQLETDWTLIAGAEVVF